MEKFFKSVGNGLTILALSVKNIFTQPIYLLFSLSLSIVTSIYFCILGCLWQRAITQGSRDLFFLFDLTPLKSAESFFVKAPAGQTIIVGIGAFFLVFLATTFIILFHAFGIAHFTMQYLKNKKTSLADVMCFSCHNWLPILKWSALISGVAVTLHILSGFHYALGTTLWVVWGFGTFFALPVIVFERLDVIKTIKKSLLLLRKLCAESVIIAAGLNIVVMAGLFSWAVDFMFNFVASIMHFVWLLVTQLESFRSPDGIAVQEFLLMIMLIFVFWLIYTVMTVVRTALYASTTSGQTLASVTKKLSK